MPTAMGSLSDFMVLPGITAPPAYRAVLLRALFWGDWLSIDRCTQQVPAVGMIISHTRTRPRSVCRHFPTGVQQSHSVTSQISIHRSTSCHMALSYAGTVYLSSRQTRLISQGKIAWCQTRSPSPWVGNVVLGLVGIAFHLHQRQWHSKAMRWWTWLFRARKSAWMTQRRRFAPQIDQDTPAPEEP